MSGEDDSESAGLPPYCARWPELVAALAAPAPEHAAMVRAFGGSEPTYARIHCPVHGFHDVSRRDGVVYVDAVDLDRYRNRGPPLRLVPAVVDDQ